MLNLVKSSFYNEAATKKALVEFITDTPILSMSEQCAQFEVAFAAKQHRTNAVFVTSGSTANLLLIQALLNLGRLKPGDKVGFSALTWPTNVMPLIQLGLIPVAIDCNLETLNVGPKQLRKHIAGLKALFLTNVLGFCDDIEKIADICKEHDVILLEDNCESLGSMVGDRLLGNFGLAATFSFFVGHHISTIEGGMIVTNDEELEEALIMPRAHGWDRNLSEKRQLELREQAGMSEFYARYGFHDLAYNARPTEINGFIGNQQIGYWDKIVSKRVEHFERFSKALTANRDFYHYDLKHMSLISNFAMPVVCKSEELAEEYRQRFLDADVEIRPVIAGDMTKQPFYKKYVKDIQDCPNSSIVHAQGFYFGNNAELTDDEVTLLCKLLEKRS